MRYCHALLFVFFPGISLTHADNLNLFDCRLPEGVHDCTLQEAVERFSSFQSSDRRPELWARFLEFFGEVEASGLVQTVLVDGSFVTAQ